MKRPFLLLLIIITWGCSPQKRKEIPKEFQKLKNLTVYPADAMPEESISFQKDAVYGSTKKVLIGSMGPYAVDSLGRVFIADNQQHTIDVFKPDGRFITHLGRKGKGPGEFLGISGLQIRGDHLYVYDESQLKETVFTLHPLALENTILLADNRDKYPALNVAWPWIEKLYVRNNHTYLAEFLSSVISRNKNAPQKLPKQWQNYDTKGMLFPLDKDGNISSKELLEFKNDTRTVVMKNTGGIPYFSFFGRSMTVMSTSNNIYQAEPDFFLIKTYSPDGAYLHAFYYPHPKIPLTKKSASEYGLPDRLIRQMKFMKLPPAWPVLTFMKIDDQDRLWVATTVQNMKDYQWWVLHPNGTLIARFTWPRNKYIKVIKNGYVYALETDPATGIQKIVRYKIEMK